MRKILVLSVMVVLMISAFAVKAVDYSLPDTDGKLQSFDQYLGKWVVVNYWATWCGTCLKELPDLISLHETGNNGDIVVVGINFEIISARRLKDFIDEYAIPYPVLHAEPLAKTPLGPVPALPTTYIIDPGGKIVAGEVGMVNRQQLEDYIQQKQATDEYAGTVVRRVEGG